LVKHAAGVNLNVAICSNAMSSSHKVSEGRYAVFQANREDRNVTVKDKRVITIQRVTEYCHGDFWVVADGITQVSFRRLPALLCLYWQVCLR